MERILRKFDSPICSKAENLLWMAKLHIAVHGQASEYDRRSILYQSSKFHYVITFHCRVITIFVKVVFVTPHKFELSQMDVKNEQRSQ